MSSTMTKFSQISVSKAPRFKENPFLETIEVVLKDKRIGVRSGAKIIDSTTGEHVATSTISQVRKVDSEQFIKLYTKDLTVWFDISRSGLRVMMALFSEVQSSALGRDIIFFDLTNKNVVDFEISRTIFYRGIEELLSRGFIARHIKPSFYFINPAIFFNGDRVRLVKEYEISMDNQKELENNSEGNSDAKH